jgi:hypothetical protein
MRCSYYPQSLAQVRGAIREIEVWIWGVDPLVLFIPTNSGHTGLIGASHWSDRCRPLLSFCSGERLGEFVVVPCGCYFEFGAVRSLVGLFGVWGFLAWTGLTSVSHRPDRCRAVMWKSPVLPVGTGPTGVAHRPDQCRSVDSSFCVPLRSQVCEVGSWFLGLVALQWLRGLGQLG